MRVIKVFPRISYIKIQNSEFRIKGKQVHNISISLCLLTTYKIITKQRGFRPLCSASDGFKRWLPAYLNPHSPKLA